jgi:hypothetical protein
VGLSKIRETATFGGLPLAERRQELKCGVWVLDTQSGQVVEFLEFRGPSRSGQGRMAPISSHHGLVDLVPWVEL